jgi:hypothetical protein
MPKSSYWCMVWVRLYYKYFSSTAVSNSDYASVGFQPFNYDRYIPSAKECPLQLELPNGEISKTNGFISPVISLTFKTSVLIFLFIKLPKWLTLTLWRAYCGLLQMWGGVVVWNPQSCIKDFESEGPVRHMISPQVFLLLINKHFWLC